MRSWGRHGDLMNLDLSRPRKDRHLRTPGGHRRPYATEQTLSK